MALDLRKAKAALRARLTATVFATTGSVALAATASGYTRASGSFVDDGFVPGMEVTPSGFSSNVTDLITAVSATTLTTKNTHPVQASSAGRTLAVSLPARRAFDGAKLEQVPGVPSMREAFVHATGELVTSGPDGGHESHTMAYLITLYMPDVYGADPLDAMATVLTQRFASGTKVGAGPVVSVRFNPGPFAGQALPADTPGFLYRLITVPCRADVRATRSA
jgi:hypothetical protein